MNPFRTIRLAYRESPIKGVIYALMFAAYVVIAVGSVFWARHLGFH